MKLNFNEQNLTRCKIDAMEMGFEIDEFWIKIEIEGWIFVGSEKIVVGPWQQQITDFQ